MIVEATKKLVRGGSLSTDEASEVMEQIMDGVPSDAQFGAFVTALHMKGESASEIAAMGAVMRERSLKVETTHSALVDTCGTGGDGKDTFNVSTAVALVMAGAGARVAKHGNRAATSRCGSADVLEALGVKIELTPVEVAECIDVAGIGFMYAPIFHPAMKFAAPLRREIAIPTTFNLLGPITNPARANRQLLGVARLELVELMANAICEMGIQFAQVVHGLDGLDEISISGPSMIATVDAGKVKIVEISPEQFGLGTSSINEIAGGEASHNAELIRDVLQGSTGARRDIVILNAAAGLVVAGVTTEMLQGVHAAAEAIDSGAAFNALDKLISVSNRN